MIVPSVVIIPCLVVHLRYELNIELSMPIDTILLQCDVPVELLDADSNAAIVSRTHVPSGLLATYRAQERVNRMEMAVRTSEGRYGNLQAYVWPRISPKMCKVRARRLAQPPYPHTSASTPLCLALSR